VKTEITQNMIFDSIDEDIAEHFSSLEDGSYMTLLPLYIHISRHLGKISKALSLTRDNYSGKSPNRCSECQDDV